MTKLQIEKRNLLVSPVICALSIKGNVDFPRAHGEKLLRESNNEHLTTKVSTRKLPVTLANKNMYQYILNECASKILTTSVAMVLQLLSGMT